MDGIIASAFIDKEKFWKTKAEEAFAEWAISEAKLSKAREALNQIADIHKRNFGHQTEKLSGIGPIACATLKEIGENNA